MPPACVMNGGQAGQATSSRPSSRRIIRHAALRALRSRLDLKPLSGPKYWRPMSATESKWSAILSAKTGSKDLGHPWGAVALVALGLGAGLASGGKAANEHAPKPDTAATLPPVSTDGASKEAAPTPTPTTAAPTPETPKPATTPAPSKPAARKPATAPKISGDGEYLVGQDMKAGTYKTAGPSDGLCYWERDKDSSGEFDSIIANGTPTGNGRVTVKKGEVFKTQGCDDWTEVG